MSTIIPVELPSYRLWDEHETQNIAKVQIVEIMNTLSDFLDIRSHKIYSNDVPLFHVLSYSVLAVDMTRCFDVKLEYTQKTFQTPEQLNSLEVAVETMKIALSS